MKTPYKTSTMPDTDSPRTPRGEFDEEEWVKKNLHPLRTKQGGKFVPTTYCQDDVLPVLYSSSSSEKERFSFRKLCTLYNSIDPLPHHLEKDHRFHRWVCNFFYNIRDSQEEVRSVTKQTAIKRRQKERNNAIMELANKQLSHSKEVAKLEEDSRKSRTTMMKSMYLDQGLTQRVLSGKAGNGNSNGDGGFVVSYKTAKAFGVVVAAVALAAFVAKYPTFFSDGWDAASSSINDGLSTAASSSTSYAQCIKESVANYVKFAKEWWYGN